MPDCKYSELPKDAQILLRAYISGWLDLNKWAFVGSKKNTIKAVIQLIDGGFVKCKYEILDDGGERFWIEPIEPGAFRG